VVAQVARRYQDKVAIIGMGSRDDLPRLEDFVEKYDLKSFPHAADSSGGLRAELGVVGQPTWIFISADGKIEKVFGELGEAGLVRRLDALVPS
jgi:peroxiredoxin